MRPLPVPGHPAATRQVSPWSLDQRRRRVTPRACARAARTSESLATPDTLRAMPHRMNKSVKGRSMATKASRVSRSQENRCPRMVVAFAVLGVACQATDGGEDGRPNLDHLNRWTLHEDLRLGDAGLPAGFSRVSDVEVDDRGRLYVLDAGEHEVRVFDAEGRSIHRFGGEGQGPGELLFPSAMGMFRDTLWVRNGNGHRITYFSLEGEVLHTLSIQDRIDVAEEGSLPVFAFLEEPVSDTLAYPGHAFRTTWTEANAYGDSVRVRRLRFGKSGEAIEMGGWTTVFPRWLNVQIEVEGFNFPVQTKLFQDYPLRFGDPRSPIVAYGWAPDGPDPGTVRLAWLDERGDLVHEQLYAFDPVALSASSEDSLLHAMAERHHENLGRGLGNAPTVGRIRQVLEETIAAPRFLPPLTDARLGRDGSIWVRREDLNRDSVPWAVLDSEGTPLGQVALPRDAELRLATLEEVWVVLPDEFSVPYVVRYRLGRGT